MSSSDAAILLIDYFSDRDAETIIDFVLAKDVEVMNTEELIQAFRGYEPPTIED